MPQSGKLYLICDNDAERHYKVRSSRRDREILKILDILPQARISGLQVANRNGAISREQTKLTGTRAIVEASSRLHLADYAGQQHR